MWLMAMGTTQKERCCVLMHVDTKEMGMLNKNMHFAKQNDKSCILFPAI